MALITKPYIDYDSGYQAIGVPTAVSQPVNTKTLTSNITSKTPTSTVTAPPKAPTPAPTPAPAPAAPVPPIAPTPPTGPPPPAGVPQGTGSQAYDDSAARAAREAELAAALRQMESQFNLSREQLLADQTEAGDQYRFIMSALQRSKEEAIAGAQSGALQRGILRSGIYQGDEAKISQEFASQESAAAADRAAKLNMLQTAIADLESQYSQGQSATSAGMVQSQLQAMRELANSLALDDALTQKATAAGWNPTTQAASGGAAGGVPGVGGAALTDLSAGRGLAAPLNTDRYNQQSAIGQQFGVGDFLDVRPTDQVVGSNGPGQDVYGGGGVPGAGAMQGGAAALGAAYYGQGVTGVDFLRSLDPNVLKGFTQDEVNYFVSQTNIDPAAAFNIASRAAYIAQTNPSYNYAGK